MHAPRSFTRLLLPTLLIPLPVLDSPLSFVVAPTRSFVASRRLRSTTQSSENMVRHGNSNPRVIKASSVANKGKIYFQKENCSKQVRCTG